MANKVFELNGKAYDALTGAYLGTASRVPHTANVQAMQPKLAPHQIKKQQVSVDGIVRQPSHKQSALSVHQRTQPTKTLMRRAVKAPAKLTGLQPQRAHQPAVSALQAPLSARSHAAASPQHITGKLSSTAIDPVRARRSLDVGRSQSVQHFKPAQPHHDMRRGYATAAAIAPTTQAAQAAPAPVAATARPAAPVAMAAAVKQQAQTTHLAPLRPGHQPQRQQSAHLKPLQDDDDFDLFSQALAEAKSHEEPAPDESALQSVRRKSRRRKQVFGIIGSLAVFLLLLGFIGLQNKDNIRLQLASAKAGFSAAVPLNKPAGYSMNKISYAPGSVAMLYTAGDSKQFTIVQKKSNWDSQTLLENFVATTNQDYQGYQSNGRTVYIYGQGQATWVNGGIWYQIKDATSLTNEQLVRIAASM